jgi:hypothetical protein
MPRKKDEVNPTLQPSHVSVAEAEMLTSVSRWTWRSWAYNRRIESTKIGSRLLIPLSEVTRVLNEGTRPRAHRDAGVTGSDSTRGVHA